MVTGAMSLGVKYWLAWAGDVASFNRYWGWYGRKPSDWAAGLDKMRADAGGKSFGISEYGAGASVLHHEVPPKQPDPGGKWHPEEYQSALHEAVWPELSARPWLWCKFLWVMFDFGSESRNEGDRPGINDKGLVTGDRKVRKDAYFYYQAQWVTDRPVIHICSKGFNPRPSGNTEVKVYSNGLTPTLLLNGRNLGSMREASPHVFVATVDLQPGKNEIQAISAMRGKSMDSCIWNCEGP